MNGARRLTGHQTVKSLVDHSQEAVGILMFLDCPGSHVTQTGNEFCWHTGLLLEALVKHSTPIVNCPLFYPQSLPMYKII